MKITVKIRIYLGFSLLVAISSVMFLASFSGFNQIEKSVHQLSESNIPTLIAAANLSTNLLTSEITLKEITASKTTTDATSIKANYDAIKDKTYNSVRQLESLIPKGSTLYNLLLETVKLNDAFYLKANSSINVAFEQLSLQDKTTELARTFGDMGDETLSAAYDLEGISDNEELNSTIENFVLSIESAVEDANSGLTSNIRFEVMSIQSDLKSSIEDLDNSLNEIASSSELAGSDAAEYMQESFATFRHALIGDGNAIATKISALQKGQQVQTQLIEAEQAALEVRALLVQLNQKVKAGTSLVEEEAISNVGNNKTISSILAMISLISSIVIALYVTKTITQPLRYSMSQLQKAANGDLTVSFKKFRNDEFSELADDLQLLVSNLRHTVQEIAQNSNSLASTAEQTSMITDNSFTSIQTQTSQIQLVNSSVKEMTETARSVSESVHQTLNEVDLANSHAKEGESLLVENINNMASLEQKIMNSAKVIEELNNNTNNITTVLDEIRGVAEQTNLLALNAAIEAARAGEQGRGFAVVADEVRTLASRAHDSTSEIQEAIEQLQQGAKKAVDTMGESQKETTHCVNGILSVQSKLESIVSGVEKIKDMSQLISTAADEQNAASESQYTTIQKIQKVADETSQQAQENLQASQQLAEMAETQNEMVGKFKT